MWKRCRFISSEKTQTVITNNNKNNTTGYPVSRFR